MTRIAAGGSDDLATDTLVHADPWVQRQPVLAAPPDVELDRDQGIAMLLGPDPLGRSRLDLERAWSYTGQPPSSRIEYVEHKPGFALV